MDNEKFSPPITFGSYKHELLKMYLRISPKRMRG